MSTAKLLILENRLGQKVRTFAVDSESLNIVYLKNSRRIEAVSNLESLDSNDIEYRLLQTVDLSQLNDQGVALEGLGRLRVADASAQNSPTYQLAEEQDDEQLKIMLKKTSLAHLAAVLSLMMGAWIWASYFTKTEEPMLVTIELPQEKPVAKAEARPHVQVAKQKVKQTNKVYRPKAQTKLKTKPYKVNTAKAKDVSRFGALAALGGTPKGTRGYEGLDNNSMKAIRSAGVGSGGGGVGSAGRGGIKGYMPGNGLIAGSAGEGSGKAVSAGGYGSAGIGGGRAGNGKISLVGGTSAVSLPLDDEASVEGGLDRDQIIAVINKNRGQIVYCYEKGLQAQPSIGGRVAVDFVIGPAGRITTAKVAQSSLGSRMVENCMLQRMKTWQFPRPVGNVNVDVLYPFELMRVSSR